MNIKNTIQYICSTFRFFGIGYMNSEDFRLAKFNKHPNINVLVKISIICLETNLTINGFNLT